MWPNPEETVVFVVHTEEILNGKLHFFCSRKKLFRTQHWFAPLSQTSAVYVRIWSFSGPFFCRIWTEYGGILRISLYSVRMRENTVQKNSEYGHFLRNAILSHFLVRWHLAELRKPLQYVDTSGVQVINTHMFRVGGTEGQGACPFLPPNPQFFSVVKTKKWDKGKKERVSKQELLKGFQKVKIKFDFLKVLSLKHHHHKRCFQLIHHKWLIWINVRLNAK